MIESLHRYIAPEMLARLATLRLSVRRRSGGALAGEHASDQVGQSVEFAEHRQYTPGDDLRYVDWKIYARSDKYYLKQSEQESQLLCYAVIDCSQSMDFASAPTGITKFEYAQRLTLALALVAAQGSDRFACAMLSDRMTQFMRPQPAATAIERLPQLFADTSAQGATNLNAAVEQFLAGAPQRGLVVLMSDLLGEALDVASALHRFYQSGHDVLVLHLMDRAESEFPLDGEIHLQGLEASGDADVNAWALRDAYRQAVSEFIASMQKKCWQYGFTFATVMTDCPLDEALARQFAR